MRCGPGVWSAITRTLVGRVVSVIVVLLRGGESRRSGRGTSPNPGPLRRPVPSVVGGLAPTGAASATSGRSTRRAWPRGTRGLTGRERRRTHRTRPAGAATAPRQPGAAHAAPGRSLDRSLAPLTAPERRGAIDARPQRGRTSRQRFSGGGLPAGTPAARRAERQWFSWRGTGRDRRRPLSFGMRRACVNRHDSQPHRTPVQLSVRA